jgi:hypothetical protein
MYQGPFSDVLLLSRKDSANCVGHSVCTGYVCCGWVWQAAASVMVQETLPDSIKCSSFSDKPQCHPKCFSRPIPAPILFQVSHTHHAINPHWSTPQGPHEYTIWVYGLLHSHSHFDTISRTLWDPYLFSYHALMKHVQRQACLHRTASDVWTGTC